MRIRRRRYRRYTGEPRWGNKGSDHQSTSCFGWHFLGTLADVVDLERTSRRPTRGELGCDDHIDQGAPGRFVILPPARQVNGYTDVTGLSAVWTP